MPESSNTTFSLGTNVRDRTIGYEETGFIHIAKNQNGRVVFLLNNNIVNYEQYTVDDDGHGLPLIEVLYEVALEVRGKISGKPIYRKRYHDFIRYWSRPTRLPAQLLDKEILPPEDATAQSGIYWLSEAKEERKRMERETFQIS